MKRVKREGRGKDGEVGGYEGAVPPSIRIFPYLYEELFNGTPVQNLLLNYEKLCELSHGFVNITRLT